MASVSSASISSSSLSSPVKSGGSKERGAKQSDSSSLDESSSESEYTSKDEKNGSSESESDSDSESGASSKSSTETESETETTPEKGVAEQSPKSRKDNAPTLTRESPRTNTNADHDVAVSIQGGSRSKSSVGVKRSATSGSASSDSVPVAKHVQRKKTGAKKTEDAKSSGGGRVHLSPRSPAITPQAERIERSAGSAGSPDALDHVHAGIGSADGYEGDLVIPTPVEEDSAGRVPEMPPVTDEEIQITQLLLAKFTNVSLGLEPSPPITLHGGDSYVVNAWVDEVLNADRQLQKAVEKFKRVLKQAVQHKEVRTVLSEVLKNSPFMINDGKSTSRSSAFSGQNRKKATMHARKERIERKRMNEDRLLQAQEAREKKEKKGQKQRKKKTFDWADVPLEPEPLDMEDEAVSRPTPDRRQISGSVRLYFVCDVVSSSFFTFCMFFLCLTYLSECERQAKERV
mmetsp:Transcript_38684/g.99316  ORF Transcript_38684/g.99316 Transcript_38684/m.99316 type:complete len:460 (-) Transcript_38684:1204-2583(-)